MLLNVVQQALEFIKTLTDEDIKDLVENKKEFVLSLKEELKQGDNNDTTGEKSDREPAEKTAPSKGRSTSEKSKHEPNKNKKTNSKKKEKTNKPSSEKVNKKESNEFDEYIRELSKFRTREEATKYLLDNKLTVTKLKILAKKLSIYIKSKSKKIDIIETIVEDIVGSMLKIEALREY